MPEIKFGAEELFPSATPDSQRFAGQLLAGVGELLPIAGGIWGLLSGRTLLGKLFAGLVGVGVGKLGERYLSRCAPRSF